jgi:hypothetical protein
MSTTAWPAVRVRRQFSVERWTARAILLDDLFALEALASGVGLPGWSSEGCSPS